LFNNGQNTKFYGGNPGSTDPSKGIILSMDNIIPSMGGGYQTFKFRSDAGAEASFKDFKEFRIFDEDTQVVLGTAAVPVVLTPPTQTAPPPTAPAAIIPAPAKQTTPSNGSTPTGDLISRASAPANFLSLGLVLAFMFLF
jgi:hypothetical protein